MTEPTDVEIESAWTEATGSSILPYPDDMLAFARAVLAKWGAPQQEAQEPCPTCAALARTVMLDQVSFDRKPDCYGIRQITGDEGIEEWEDIRTSPDVAREEANDMMATGRGEIYEVVPLWTTPQPTQAQAGSVTADDLKQPRNGAQWRVEWWNESCRMLLPANKRLDSFQTYRNGTLMFTIKEKYGIKGGQHGTE